MSRKKEATRKKAMDTAIAVLAKTANASLADIAQASGIGRTTLHRYFPTRDDLIDALALQAIEETNAAVEAFWSEERSAQAVLLEILEAMIPLGDRYHFLYRERASYKNCEIAEAYMEQRGSIQRLIVRLKQEGVISVTVQNEWAEIVIDNLIWSAWQAIDEGVIAPRQSAQMVYNTICSGLSWSED
ncbi:TetR/AcrR family transcriptional regulator [Endozoicomonas arenosclerae]|uniref:TetR/AcrR family transcriptional regulator n=1 Tax=Endozoicomonas arenosclerae TaxID=1633495 RepID=UPI000783B909|nr:TetR/AcrR family transcriptional regulator [Endozoicomonas arenosclerae]